MHCFSRKPCPLDRGGLSGKEKLMTSKRGRLSMRCRPYSYQLDIEINQAREGHDKLGLKSSLLKANNGVIG